MDPKQAIGAALTIIGLLIFLYVIASGAGSGAIGSEDATSSDALMTIAAWFMILAGPALWFGETPAVIKRRAGR
ncbi:MAG: hypothetical protein F7C08_00905 [Desulfurococcales archaeon]|nr:hypothetical protein [Desulfurococcales archaeon]MCE4605080.1 hypothetical protein [Desulfurococcales archaeon]